MQYLYSGGCQSLNVASADDVLELMAAASFFQLDDLLRYSEMRYTQLIDIDNIVSTYIHSKVIEFHLNLLVVAVASKN